MMKPRRYAGRYGGLVLQTGQAASQRCGLRTHCRLSELLDLLRHQVAPLSGLEAAVGNRPDARAFEPLDRMADCFTHPPHLTVASFSNRDLQHALVPAGVEEFHVGGT